MSRHFLNIILPAPVRNYLRRFALATIPSMRHLDMPKRLAQLKRNGFLPRSIVDVGAAHGDWARLAAQLWPDAPIFGFEPNLTNKPELEKTKQDLPHFDYRQCFLGPTANPAVKYSNTGTQTSLYDTTITDATTTAQAPMQTLDDLVAQHVLTTPDFIKLDVQGFELEVLKGATQTLKQGQCVLMEVNFFQSHSAIPTVDQAINFMREHGFAWYDVAGIIRRPGDDALWQMDFMFLRQDHPLRHRATWS